MFRRCFNSQDEGLPILADSKKAGKFICDPNDILASGIPTGLVTVTGALSAYGFVRYSQDLLENLFGKKVSDGLGYACGVPIALLSGASGGKVITNILSNPKKSLVNILKNLVTLGILNREDLLHRDFDSKAKLYVIRFATSAAGIITFFAVPLSVIASDALNYSHSETWLSTGPNTGNSFLMNAFYLKGFFDLALNYLAAWLSDVDREKRSAILKMLIGLKNELPKYANQHNMEFLTWLQEFSECQDTQSKLIKLAELQSKLDAPQAWRYDASWSIMGIFMLLGAAALTLPLIAAGDKSEKIFKDNYVIYHLIKLITPITISVSSCICNLPINGINAYKLGNNVGEMARTIYHDGYKSYFSHLHRKNYLGIIAAIFFAILAATAQAGAAWQNPIIQSLVEVELIVEVIFVGLGALALYFMASNSYATRVANFRDRWNLRNIQDFSETYNSIEGENNKRKYIEVLSKVVQEKIDHIENEVLSAAYKASDKTTIVNIEMLSENQTIVEAVDSIPTQPSCWRSLCCFFGKSTRQEGLIDGSDQRTDDDTFTLGIQ